ncbi:MAG: cytosine permease, partial [Pirellulales bacterium]
LADPTGYIFKWLVAYSALLGAVGGVLIADYFVIRRTRLDLAGLYKKDGPYWYSGGFNLAALIALILGIFPCVPGFLAAVSESWKASLPTFWSDLYNYAWFISFGISFVVYVVLMKLTRGKSA